MSDLNVRKHKLYGKNTRHQEQKPKYELFVELEVPEHAERLREDER